MSENTDRARIDDVAPGDFVAVDRGSGEQPQKVVHKDFDAATGRVLVTFETDNGETFDVDYAAGSQVSRTLEAKWESDQSPTPPT